MKLYIIRHAPAQLRHEFAQSGKPDSLRPLTERGIDKMHSALNFFKKHEESIDIFLQSPLTRCVQTGEVCKKYFPNALFKKTKNLTPDHSAQELYNEIMSYDVDALAIIGHEPDLGQFISWLLFRQATDHFPIKKTGFAKVDIYKDGRCYLKWILRPKLMTR